MRGTKRGHRFGQFYAKLCCACAIKRGFDLTIANHGGACGNCLARNIESLSSHTHLHLDTLCAKLSNMIYESQEESQEEPLAKALPPPRHRRARARAQALALALA